MTSYADSTTALRSIRQAVLHLSTRAHSHTGRALAELELIQNRIAVHWAGRVGQPLF